MSRDSELVSRLILEIRLKTYGFRCFTAVAKATSQVGGQGGGFSFWTRLGLGLLFKCWGTFGRFWCACVCRYACVCMGTQAGVCRCACMCSHICVCV